MGLDISAISNIKINKIMYDEENSLYVNPDFPDRCDEYKKPNSNLSSYSETDKTVYHDFRAGSYSGYNKFRNILSEAILDVPAYYVWEDRSSFEGRPMYELIDFSDCEGSIDSIVSSKLYTDFVENRNKYIEYIKENVKEEFDDYLEIYDNFMLSLKIASDNGVLIFR